MEEALKKLNRALEDTLEALSEQHSKELSTLLATSQDVKLLPPQMPELDKSIGLLTDLQQTLTPPLHTLVDGFFAFVTSKALLSATELLIPDLLSTHGPSTTPQLAHLTHTSHSDLAQILRLLSSIGIFTYNPTTSHYANNPPSTLLLTTHWTQWHRWVRLYTRPFYDLLTSLPASLPLSESRSATQIAFNAPAETPMYAILGAQPWAGELQAALAAGAKAQAPGLLADYKWAEVARGKETTVCDLGGGDGAFLAELLRENEGMRGALLELEGSAGVAEKNFFGEGEGKEARFKGLGARVEGIHAGDFFAEVPKYPVYTIRWTLHNWGDEKAKMILKKVREAMVVGPASRLLIIESVVREESGGLGRMGRPALYGSIIMMVGAKGGGERTQKEWEALCGDTGWRIDGVYALRNCIPSIIDLRPL